MKNEKENLKVNEEITKTEVNETEENVEGYDYCDSHKQRCSNDCFGTPVLSHLN